MIVGFAMVASVNSKGGESMGVMMSAASAVAEAAASVGGSGISGNH